MKRVLFVCVILILISTSVNFSSCSNISASKIDVVNGIKPFDVNDIEWRKEFITSLKNLTPAERKERIDQILPKLNAQLTGSLRTRGLDCEIKSITYVFGSGDAKGVGSGDNKKYDGYFEDQLYAVVKGGKCFGDSLMAFVQCFNGVFTIEGDNQQTIGTYGNVFTIEKRQGINTYVDYLTSIWLAEKFHLTLYEGHLKNRKVITPQRARQLKDKLAQIAVTVAVNTGDQFDLNEMTYKPALK